MLDATHDGQEPDLCVIVPLYNKAGTINRAIASVLAQKGVVISLIVVDDGSTDDSTARIAPAFAGRYTLLRQTNQGPGAARNAGAAAGRGRHLAFLDADDEWLPGFAAAGVAALDAHSECGAYAAAYVTGNARVQRELLHELAPASGSYDIAGQHGPIPTKLFIDTLHSSASMIRRARFEALGGFYAKDRCTYGEDSWLWIQVAFGGPVYMDRAKLSVFHVEDSSLGAARKGAHPRLPALVEPETLRARCRPELVRQLDALLAFYRLIETEQMVNQHRGRDVAALRARFPWPSIPQPFMLAREVRVRALAIARR